MVSNASLLLADEPTANLDWSIGQSIVQTLSNIAHTQNRSVIVVSHDPRLEPFADRVISLQDGVIVGQRRAGRAVTAILALLAILAVAVIGWFVITSAGERGVAQTMPQTNPQTIPPSPPSENDEGIIASAPAVTEPFSRTINLSCDRTGIITAIDVESGQDVAKGEILVQLDDAEARAQSR